MRTFRLRMLKFFLSFSFLLSCQQKSAAPSKQSIEAINLKRGSVISCGVTDKQFGSVEFEMDCNPAIKKDFNLAIELLHSFEYDEAEKAFAKVIDQAPDCAMAYWGVAMSNFHPLWTPPTESELQKGSKAIAIANNIGNKSERESAYIHAIDLFYKDWEQTDHNTRCVKFEKAMEQLHSDYPTDKEAAVFYALALDAAADPTDKTYGNQKKAASLLNALYPAEPNHPGIIHYIIHTYDYPELAILALPAAKKYALVAPSSAHALHMPSHIFTRLGMWDDCIQSNLLSVASAQCYATAAGIKGHWDEELHGLDYIVYAYLQKGENDLALAQLQYIDSIKAVSPINFKVAYAFAAIPSRIVLENKQWAKAAALKPAPSFIPWPKFPWQEAIVHFTRAMGGIHLHNASLAYSELAVMKQLRDTLEKQKDGYKSKQVSIQIKSAEAWIQFQAGNKLEGLNLMRQAANMEDSTEKHPVTPGEVIPARELLADMLSELQQYNEALQAYEAVLKKSPNRFNSLYGAGLVAEKSGDEQKAVQFYQQLISISDAQKSNRSELSAAKSFLATHQKKNG